MVNLGYMNQADWFNRPVSIAPAKIEKIRQCKRVADPIPLCLGAAQILEDLINQYGFYAFGNDIQFQLMRHLDAGLNDRKLFIRSFQSADYSLVQLDG